jgi:hypothetical protein
MEDTEGTEKRQDEKDGQVFPVKIHAVRLFCSRISSVVSVVQAETGTQKQGGEKNGKAPV